MAYRIGILNNYSDEPVTAPSAGLFRKYLNDSDIINICHGETIKEISRYNGYIISGSRSSHLEHQNWITQLIDVVKTIYKLNIPCLAVCFGHQLVAKVFGGETAINYGEENGFMDVPTDYSLGRIELFDSLPNPVKIYQSHNDAVISAPPGSEEVIRNDRCIQYFKYGSIYSIQAHPEINVEKAIAFAKRDDQKIEQILNGVNKEDIISYKILYNFSKIIKKTSTIK